MDSSFQCAAVGNGRTREGTEVCAVLSDTGQGGDVINVSFVGVDQVGDRSNEVLVIIDGSSQLVQGVKQTRSAIHQSADCRSTGG